MHYFNLISCFVIFCRLCSISCLAAPPDNFDQQQRLDYEHDFIEGNKLKLLGDLPGAANLLTRCTEANPNAAAVFFALSDIYMDIENNAEALKNARRAVQLDAGNIWYKLRLSELYLASDLVDSAIMICRDMVTLEPDNIDLRMDLSDLYLATNQYKKALKEVKKVEQTYGFTKEVAIARYKIYAQKGAVRNMKKVLQKSIDKFPDELRFYGLLAEMYSSTGKQKEAQENYRKLLDEDPDNALGLISMIEFYKGYGNEEKVLSEMKRMYDNKAIHPDLKVELYLSLTSDTVFAQKYVQPLDSMVALLCEKYPDNFRVRMVNADRNLRRHNLEAAKEDLLFITNRVTTNSFLWTQLLYVLNLLEDNQTLFDSSAKALEYFSNHYLFNFFHGLSASLLKKTDEAILSLNKTLECLKKEKESDKAVELQTLVFLAEAYNEQKKYSQSDHVFDMALMLAPNHPLVLNNYSYYLSLRGEKLDKAEQYIKKCIAMEPNSSTYLDTYGWVLYKLGRIEEAILMIEKAILNGGQDSPEIVDHLCELLVVAGRMDEADKACRKAIELNHEQKTVEQKM
ncbi:MAG: tetratricopeptide repeat protein, partial [Bacteroidales bacterium]|nr:tetratricopeptide repeat protein [Bacteroidales bacterium]